MSKAKREKIGADLDTSQDFVDDFDPYAFVQAEDASAAAWDDSLSGGNEGSQEWDSGDSFEQDPESKTPRGSSRRAAAQEFLSEEEDFPDISAEPAPQDRAKASARQKDALKAEERPLVEVCGSTANIAKYGSPIGSAEHQRLRYYFFPTWRSQLLNLGSFFVLSALCVICSRYFPLLVVSGKLFTWGEDVYMLHFPILILVPAYILGRILFAIYDAKYIIDESGVEAQVGLLSLNLRQPRLRWEDIRGSEPQQTLWERILGIGRVLIGSAMTDGVEIEMRGVTSPKAIQLLIQGERERRLKSLQGKAAIHSVISD